METEFQKSNVQVGQFTDQIIKEIIDIQNNFIDLVNYSSLRYFHKVTEIYQFDESDVNLEFDISQWTVQAKHYVIKYKHNRQKNPNRRLNQNKSCWSCLCPCFVKAKDRDKDQTSSQDLGTNR